MIQVLRVVIGNAVNENKKIRKLDCVYIISSQRQKVKIQFVSRIGNTLFIQSGRKLMTGLLTNQISNSKENLLSYVG